MAALPRREAITPLNIDVTDVWMPNPPSEWAVIPPEILERLIPPMVSYAPVPGPFGIDRRTGARLMMPIYNNGIILTPQQKAELDKLAAGRWFLVKNQGEVFPRARCGRSGCNRLHPYLTLACVERPFHGLNEISALIEQHTEVKGGHEHTIDIFRLGSIVPITKKKAMELADRIRGRGESLVGSPKPTRLEIVRR